MGLGLGLWLWLWLWLWLRLDGRLVLVHVDLRAERRVLLEVL